MTQDVAAVDAETPLADVVDLMEKRDIKRVPVLRGGKIVGIIARALRALTRIPEALPPHAVNDNVIRDRIIDEIGKQDWAPHNAINISVRDGRVTLTGVVLDEQVRVAIAVAAEGVPGVQAVRNDIEVAMPNPAWM